MFGLGDPQRRRPAADPPYIIEMAMAVSHEGGLGGCDDDHEFGIALDLILDGLEKMRDSAPESSRQ